MPKRFTPNPYILTPDPPHDSNNPNSLPNVLLFPFSERWSRRNPCQRTSPAPPPTSFNTLLCWSPPSPPPPPDLPIKAPPSEHFLFLVCYPLTLRIYGHFLANLPDWAHCMGVRGLPILQTGWACCLVFTRRCDVLNCKAALMFAELAECQGYLQLNAKTVSS